MNRKCDQLRSRAMAHGEDSEDYAAWVLHCRHCPDCQSELFILETLRDDAEGEKVHLPREKVAQLAMMAQARYGRRRKYRPLRIIWSAVWKLSAMAAMVALLLHVVPLEWGHKTMDSPQYTAVRSSETKAQLARVNESEFEGFSQKTDFTPLGPGESMHEQRLAVAASEGYMDLFNLLPGQAFENRIRETGKRIERQREELDTLIDHDLMGY